MSQIAVGPALDIDGPLPVAPEYSLLSIPGVVVAGDGGDRWMNGVVVDSYPTETPESWDPCSAGTFRVKTEGDSPPLPRFDPFVLYVPITCSSLSFGDNWEGFARRAELVLEATQSWGVEKALSQGVSQSSNPFLADTNMVLLEAGAHTPASGLAWLEEAIGATGRGGIIHASPGVVAQWGFNQLETGPVLRTANGTPVAVGGGYSGADPVDEAGPAAGQSYVFATGPVEVRLSEPMLIPEDINGALDTSNNDVTFRAERFALVTWDTALQAAVLIDWSP